MDFFAQRFRGFKQIFFELSGEREKEDKRWIFLLPDLGDLSRFFFELSGEREKEDKRWIFLLPDLEDLSRFFLS
jgi:hypothetical protein